MAGIDLSIIILTLNEERSLPACLASLSDLDCDVFVVDSGSSDRTVELAREHGARVVAHPFENYSAQRNWALENLPLESEWVLNLDADERLTPELVRELRETLSGEVGVDAFLLRQRTVFMGRWIRHGGHYPSYHLRLFRRGMGRCEDRLYDQHFLVDGRVGRLRSDYVDTVTSDVQEWTRRHLGWAPAEARAMTAPAGRDQVVASALGTPIQRKRWLRSGVYGRAPLFVRAFAYWIYRYVLRFGFLDGTEGLIFHFLQGCWFRVLVDIHVWQLRRGPRPANPVAGGADTAHRRRPRPSGAAARSGSPPYARTSGAVTDR